MKKIIIVQGGGRLNGNTEQLVQAFERGAMAAGHKVKIVSLRNNVVNGCIGCNACRYEKPCIQNDSFNELIPTIKEADLIVLCCQKIWRRP